MYFIVHLQNNKSTKVSPQMFFFFSFLFFVGRSILCKFISHNCSKQSLRWEQRAEGSWRAYNHTLQPGFPPQAWGGGGEQQQQKKKKTETFLRSPQSPLVLACPDPPAPHPTNKHTLCFSMVCCCGFFIYLFLPSQQQRATLVSAFFSPNKGVRFDKRLAHSRRHELF